MALSLETLKSASRTLRYEFISTDTLWHCVNQDDAHTINCTVRGKALL